MGEQVVDVALKPGDSRAARQAKRGHRETAGKRQVEVAQEVRRSLRKRQLLATDQLLEDAWFLAAAKQLAHGQRTHVKPRQPARPGPDFVLQLCVYRPRHEEAAWTRISLDRSTDRAERARDVLPLVEEDRLRERFQRCIGVGSESCRLVLLIKPNHRLDAASQRRALTTRSGPEHQQCRELLQVLVEKRVDEPKNVV